MSQQTPQKMKKMEEKTMKKKLILGILAAALSLTLAISGTLMLFTATTEEDPATNVVTLGNAAIQMWEHDGTLNTKPQMIGGKYEDEEQLPKGTYVDDVFKGIDFDVVAPGASLNKKTYVENTGDVNVYVYVKGVLKLYDEEGNPVDLNDLDDDVLAQVAAISKTLDADDLGDNWYGSGGYAQLNSNGEYEGYYYRVNSEEDEGETGTLLPLAVGATTGSIFKNPIVIPATTVGNALANYKFEFVLTAYAVQSDHNTVTAIVDEEEVEVAPTFVQLKEIFESQSEL
jgi:hypothetical protein